MNSCAANGYKYIEQLTDKENGPLMVRNNKTQKFWVQKEYPGFLADSLETLKKIQHKNLPKIEEIIVSGDKVFLYEEYIHGKTLSEIIYASDSMSGEEILRLAQNILAALAALHKEGLIHRDIKPSNIMLTNDQTVKLIDFDAVRRISGDKENDTIQLGTVGFAAPEQFGFAESDARSDIYSLGVVMNICSTRDYPKNRLTEDPLIQSIVIQATKIDPKDRYQQVAEMAAAVEAQLSGAAAGGHGEPYNASQLEEELQEQTAKAELYEEEELAFAKDRKWKREFSLVSIIRGVLRAFQYIPGFRTRQIWKMFLAIVGYAFLFMIMTSSSSYEDTFEKRIRWAIDCLFIFILPLLLYANFLDFHKHISLLNSNSVVKKFFGYVFLTIVWFVLAIVYTLYLRGT
ncbi:serine/threonine-protein kinase [Enterococcus sp. BWR-S5]|uniref:serine/threonine-protein kinase n=1 Tax=Enterococcus sp. BWR-S5 TaxID=2787714 RepID=UPI00192386CD|nr:serine/threonine-protein kinase [Enterococcus sp. BWR-S5]MBL1226157.1 serine/threonine protein kinase [Enterococcus sp. BWR-S5]